MTRGGSDIQVQGKVGPLGLRVMMAGTACCVPPRKTVFFTPRCPHTPATAQISQGRTQNQIPSLLQPLLAGITIYKHASSIRENNVFLLIR